MYGTDMAGGAPPPECVNADGGVPTVGSGAAVGGAVFAAVDTVVDPGAAVDDVPPGAVRVPAAIWFRIRVKASDVADADCWFSVSCCPKYVL